MALKEVIFFLKLALATLLPCSIAFLVGLEQISLVILVSSEVAVQRQLQIKCSVKLDKVY